MCGANVKEGSREETFGGDTSDEDDSLSPSVARLIPAKVEIKEKEKPNGKENEEGMMKMLKTHQLNL